MLTKNPNIYFIISDMFPSSEYLKILYDDDNENFLEFFKKINLNLKIIIFQIILILLCLWQSI